MFAIFLSLFGGLIALGGGKSSASTANTSITTTTVPEPERDPTETDDTPAPVAVTPTPTVTLRVTDTVASGDDETPTPTSEPIISEPVISEPTIDVATPTVVVSTPTIVSPPNEGTSTPNEDVVTVTPEPAVVEVIVADADTPTVTTPEIDDVTTSDGGSSTSNGPTSGDNTPVSANAATTVTEGRVATLELPDAEDIDSVRILELPEFGNVTVNADNTLALVLTGTDDVGALNFDYEVTLKDGTVETRQMELDVVESQVESGWGEGNFYMLEVDAETNHVVVEHGENHRDVFVSGSDEALSRDDIAALEGIDAADVTGRWLADNPQYGGSEGMPLDDKAGAMLWKHITNDLGEPSSHWLQLESGYEYEMGGLIYRNADGESELHPLHITSYGEGEKPILLDNVRLQALPSENVVFSNIEFQGAFTALTGNNIILDNVTFQGDELVVQNVGAFTVRDSSFYDIYHEEPVTDSDIWEPTPNRMSGVFASNVDGLLLDNNLFDKIGWEDDYDPDLSTDGGQPPSIFSHNIYISTNVTDVTVRDNISMQGASFGAQIRSGGFIEDNVFIENNAAIYFAGGIEGGIYNGNYSLFTGNVITSGANKIFGTVNGLTAGGIGNYAPDSTLIDNIVAHMADPNNPDEVAERTSTDQGLRGAEATFDNTIVYNWTGTGDIHDDAPRSQNTEGLDTALADQTTIQILAAQLLDDDDATIADLGLYLRESGDGAFNGMTDADMIAAFFQQGFGISTDDRLGSDTLRFTPNDLGDGVRWDNRLNWDTNDLPGTFTSDSVDLAGNWVIYSGTTTLQDLGFGEGGRLSVDQGLLTINGEIDSAGSDAQLTIDGAGQVWTNGYSDTDMLTLTVEGGRFANTDEVDGLLTLNASDGQVLLATEGAEFEINAGSSLNITGGDTSIGFEGTNGGTAILRINEDGTLRFEATETGMSTIEEFRSGHNGDDAVDVASGVDLNDGSLELDLNDLGTEATDVTLISVDELIGNFSSINVTGLSNLRDVRLVMNYENDEVILRIGEEGTGDGTFRYSQIGNSTDQNAGSALWDALTEGQPVLAEDDIPDVITVNGEEITEFL